MQEMTRPDYSDASETGRENIHVERAAAEKHPPKDIDLLTLKKMVIEDIRKEMMSGGIIDAPSPMPEPVFSDPALEMRGDGPPSESDKAIRDKQRARQDEIQRNLEQQNESVLSDGQESILNALTEQILEEYLRNEQEEAKLAGLTDEERKIEEERRKLNSFMSGQFRPQEDQMSESFKRVGEEMITEKLAEIFEKELPKQKMSTRQSQREEFMRATDKSLQV